MKSLRQGDTVKVQLVKVRQFTKPQILKIETAIYIYDLIESRGYVLK